MQSIAATHQNDAWKQRKKMSYWTGRTTMSDGVITDVWNSSEKYSVERETYCLIAKLRCTGWISNQARSAVQSAGRRY